MITFDVFIMIKPFNFFSSYLSGAKVLKVFEDCRQLSLSKSLTDDTIFSVVNSQIERK